MSIIPNYGKAAGAVRAMVAVPVALAVALVAAVTLASCSSSGGARDDGRIRVVATTNVYGAIAEQLGGSRVDVQSIISDPSQDPHSYEASARTQLALSKADVVIENGGGYDDFVHKMIASAGSDPTVLDAVMVSGKKAPAGGELNEHVWYDLPSVVRIAGRLVDDLSAADPADAARFGANGSRFTAAIETLQTTAASINSAHAGEGVAITEPVPLYLLTACGLVNRTPQAFSAAVEAGSDVPVKVLDDTLRLFSEHAVAELVYNAQTSGTETVRLLGAAKRAGVAAVPVTETLPEGKDYVSWMTDNLAAIRSAVA